MSLAGAIKAGAAYVEITGDQGPLEKALGKAKSALGNFASDVNRGFDRAIAGATKLQDTISSIASEARLLGGTALAAGAGIVTPIVGAAVNFGNAGGNLKDMAARTGVAVGALQELGYAAKLNGASIEDFETSVRQMSKTIVAAAHGSDEANNTLESLGVSFQDLAGLNPEGQFKKIATALDRVGNSTLKAGLATDIFGRSGTKLLPMLQGGARGLREWGDEARNLGIVLSDDAIDAADKFGDSLDRLGFVTTSISNAIGAAAVPALDDFIQGAIRAGREVTAWIDRNPEFVTSALVFGTGLATLGGGLIGLSFALDGAAYSLKPFILGLTLAQSTIAFTLSPLGLLAAGVAGLGYAWLSSGNRMQGVMDTLGAGFTSLWNTAQTAIKGIGDAIAAGDFKGAWDIAVTAMQSVWNKAIGTMLTKLRDFAAQVVSVFKSIAESLEHVMTATTERIINATTFLAKLRDRLATNAIGYALGASDETINAVIATNNAKRDAWRDNMLGANDKQSAANQASIQNVAEGAMSFYNAIADGFTAAGALASEGLTALVDKAKQARNALTQLKPAGARGDQSDAAGGDLFKKIKPENMREVVGTFSGTALSQIAGSATNKAIKAAETTNTLLQRANELQLRVLDEFRKFGVGA